MHSPMGYSIVGNCLKPVLCEYKETRQGVQAQFCYYRNIGSDHKAGGFSAWNE